MGALFLVYFMDFLNILPKLHAEAKIKFSIEITGPQFCNLFCTSNYAPIFLKRLFDTFVVRLKFFCGTCLTFLSLV